MSCATACPALRDESGPTISHHVLDISELCVCRVQFVSRLECEVKCLTCVVCDFSLNNEGLVLGDPGMTLGTVRFYPGAFAKGHVIEVFQLGEVLSDISTGSEPALLESIPLAVNASVTGQNLELTQVLQSAQGAYVAFVNNVPAAPHGFIEVDQNTVNDVNSRPYTQLLKVSGGVGPFRLTQPGKGDEPRFLRGLPDWSNTGMTLSWWWRWKPCTESCGVFFLWAQSNQTGANCNGQDLLWNVWLETDGIWVENGHPQAKPTHQYPLNFMDDRHKWRGEETWRHVAMTFDDFDDKVYLYMDGVEAWSGAFGSNVGGADCHSTWKTLALGHATPGWRYGAEFDIYDMRMYKHQPSDTSVLLKTFSAGLASHSAPGISSSFLEGSRCIPMPLASDTPWLSNEALKNSAWLDAYGHGCDWYGKHIKTHPALCNLDSLKDNCRLSCPPSQECFTKTVDPKVYWAWDRIRRIDSVGTNGTVCLSDGSTKETLVDACRKWSLTGETGDMTAWLADAIGGDQTLRRVDLRDCDELEASIDEQCSFSEKAVKDFTRDVKANSGDYTIGVWVRPLKFPGPRASLHTDGNFYPSLNFLSSVSPPQHNVAVGRWFNLKGEARLYTNCPAAGKTFVNVEVHRASNDGWTFVAIVRRGSMTPEFTATATNLNSYKESEAFKQCLYDDSHFFRALEVNYPMLLSPLMMVPEALSEADTQRLFLQVTIRSVPRVSQTCIPYSSCL